MSVQAGNEPRKAYCVERYYRAKTMFLVYADSAEDAKERCVMDGEAIDSTTLGGTKTTVRRWQEEDRDG